MKLALAFVLLTGPAFGQDKISIDFQNTSTQKVSIMGVYPEAVDDNLGSAFEIAPGETRTVDLGLTRCMRVEIGARFADGEEVWGHTDLCKNRTIILHD